MKESRCELRRGGRNKWPLLVLIDRSGFLSGPRDKAVYEIGRQGSRVEPVKNASSSVELCRLSASYACPSY